MVTAAALVAATLRVPVFEVSYGRGPAITFRAGIARVKVAPLPLGGSVIFLNRGHQIPPRRPDDRLHEDGPVMVRVLLEMSGPVALMAVAAGALGQGALSETWRGFPQFWRLAADFGFDFTPRARIAYHGLPGAGVWLLTKFAAFNLLPIPILNGGQAIVYALEGVAGRRLSERVRAAMVQVAVIMAFAALVVARAVV